MTQDNSNNYKTNAWYALRRTLPIWRFEENLKELIQYVQVCHVDEVIVKIDTEEFSHGHPSIEWAKNYQTNLFKVKEELNKIGVVFSLNPWITIGHIDRGRNNRQELPGLQTIVGHNGTQCTSCACPLCEVWKEHIRELWTLYAETQPHVIWVEDDIRTFNHLPVKFGCFCPEHMKLFSQRMGKNIEGAELVEAILKPGVPNPYRKEYLDMQGEVMIDTAAFLAGVVHKTSPQTCMGLMSSGPRNHCIEARQWEKFTDALADGRTLYSRSPLGSYSENSLRDCYFSHDAIKCTRYCMPDGYIEQAEVENYPYTLYSKSTTFTFIQMAITYAYGGDGVAMNLYDHCGTPMGNEPEFAKLLTDKKQFLNALAQRSKQKGIYRGVRLLHHDKASYYKQLPENAGFENLAGDGYCMMEMLESHGIATTYDDSDVIATCGQTLRAFSDEQIRKMLQGAMFIDAEAACVLVERGFAKEIGVKSIQQPQLLDTLGVFSAEEFFNEKFGGLEKTFLTLTMPNLGGRPDFSIAETLQGAEPISRLVDPDTAASHTCMYAYENGLGGRVIVHLLDLASAYGIAFNSTFRAKQLRNAIEWLSRGRIALCVQGGVYPLALRKDCEEFTLLGLFNLTLDRWPYVKFEFQDERVIDKMEILTQAGQWEQSEKLSRELSNGRICVRYNDSVQNSQPLFVTVWWKG